MHRFSFIGLVAACFVVACSGGDASAAENEAAAARADESGSAGEPDEPQDPEELEEPDHPGESRVFDRAEEVPGPDSPGTASEPDRAEEISETPPPGPAPEPDRAEELAPASGKVAGPVRLLVLTTTNGPGAGVDEVAAAGKRLRAALDALDHLQVLGPGDLEQESMPARVREELARVANHARKGRENLLNLDLDQAVESYQTARVLLRKNLHWLDDPDPMIDVLMGLAESLAAAGNTQGAREAYHEVLVFSPGYEPDPGQVPGKYRSLFDEVRQDAAGELAGSVAVESVPPGAAVTLDGLTAGETPVVKSGVPAGLHALRVKRDGCKSHRETIEVFGGETTSRTLTLQPLEGSRLVRATRRALAAAPGSGSGPQPPEAPPAAIARDLARAADVAAVVLSQLCRSGDRLVLTVAVVERNGGAHRLGARLDGGDEDEVVRTLAWQVSDALDKREPAPAPANLGLDFEGHLLGAPRPKTVVAIHPIEPVVPAPERTHPGVLPGDEPPPPAEEDVPLWGKWWFWTGAGALVVGAVATTLALTLDREVETRYDPDTIHIVIERVVPR